jgi:hypothetical protein
MCQGVYVGECLGLGLHGKVLRGKQLLPTELGKSDRPGREEGLRKRYSLAELGTHCTNRKG